MKAKPGTYADTINQVLDDYTDAATAVHHEARRLKVTLSKEQMRLAIEQRY
jgi:hypothetical protein